jgi:pilus assembly protein CpaE
MNAPAFMTGKTADGDDREPFAAYLSDEQTTTALTQVIEEHGWNASRIQAGGIANAVRSLSVTASPHILIIDLSQSTDMQADISALAEVCEPGTIVIALGETNDVNLYRGLLGAGIFDYLVKPATPELLRSAIQHAEEALHTEPEPEPMESESGRLVTFIGLRGGAGTSTVAINTAWTIAEDLKQPVGYLDLDVSFGTSALCFDLEPGRGLADALENPGRVDSLFIERAMLKQSENLAILGAESPVGDAVMPDPAALVHLIDEMREHFSIVALEVPRHLMAHYPFMLTESAEIVLVCDLTLASVRDTIRVLGYLRDVAPKVKVTLVANRVGTLNEVTPKDFEHAVERSIDLQIPLDAKTAMTAAKSAKMLAQISKASKPAVALHQLAQKVTGLEPEAKAKPFWAKLTESKPKAEKKNKDKSAKGKDKAKK